VYDHEAVGAFIQTRLKTLDLVPCGLLRILTQRADVYKPLGMCLSIEKLTTLPTELLTTPLWNIWAFYPLLCIRRGVSVSLTSSATGQYLGGV